MHLPHTSLSCLKALCLLIIAASSILEREAVAQDTPSPLNTRVCVYDAEGGAPLDSASVAAQIEGAEVSEGLTQGDGCVSLSIAVPVGVEEEASWTSGFRMSAPYPNPASNRVEVPVEVVQARSVEVSVFTLLGRRLSEEQAFQLPAGSHNLTLDLSQHPAGLYIIRAKTENQVFTVTVMKSGSGKAEASNAVPISISAASDLQQKTTAGSGVVMQLTVKKEAYNTVYRVVEAEEGETIEVQLSATIDEPTNQAPALTIQPDVTVMAADSLNLTLFATDPDGDPLSLTVISKPGGFTTFTELDNSSGLFAITPASGDTGSYPVIWGADDGQAVATDTFLVTVTPVVNADDSAMVAINDLGTGRYHGFQGGLYPGGQNTPPQMHHTAGLLAANGIEPLDVNGNPDPAGKYILLSVGMSNTTQEFCSSDSFIPCDPWTFMGQAAADPALNTSSLVIVNGARGHRSAADWVSPDDVNYERVKTDRIESLGLSEAQVQIVWVKVANPRPLISLPDPAADAYLLQQQMGEIARALKVRYPNLKQVFFSSRIYAGYANGVSKLNPEPYAYESAFSVKWVIEAQINQMQGQGPNPIAGDLDYNNGWLAWGPYLWADGTNARSDGLVWLPEDFDDDFTHPGMKAEQKVGAALLDFFKTSAYTQCWFVKEGVCG